MPIQWSETKRTEIQGLNYVQCVVNNVGCIFNKVDGTNDIGLDGYIEFVQDKSPTGLCVGIQVKAGNSNLSGNSEVKGGSKSFRILAQPHFTSNSNSLYTAK